MLSFGNSHSIVAFLNPYGILIEKKPALNRL